jgi:hypothetical protein
MNVLPSSSRPKNKPSDFRSASRLLLLGFWLGFFANTSHACPKMSGDPYDVTAQQIAHLKSSKNILIF